MTSTLTVMYRGPLTSCNYACTYCPFAKRVETKSRLEQDRDSLANFVDWLVAETNHRWRVILTPWGEALVRGWYREAFRFVSQFEHVDFIAAQTNLSCDLDWLGTCNSERAAIWATYHPSECSQQKFVDKVLEVRTRRIRISVGAVGVTEQLSRIESLREALPEDVYLWINPQQPRPRPYHADEVRRMVRIDPQFELTLKRRRSLGRSCRTGETTFTVDGNGAIRRCFFIDEIIGNIHDPNWQHALRARVCPRTFCSCYLGVSQLLSPDVDHIRTETRLERLPGLF